MNKIEKQEKTMGLVKKYLRLLVARNHGDNGYLVMISYFGKSHTIIFDDKKEFKALNFDLENKDHLEDLLLS